MYGTTDDPLLARAEAAAMYDMSKSSGTHHLGYVKDSLYAAAHHGDLALHHNNNRQLAPLHGFGAPGESMLDQLSAVSMPLSGYAPPEHVSAVTSYAPHSAQSYNVVSSSHGHSHHYSSSAAAIQQSMQQLYSPGSLSPHSAAAASGAMTHPHDIECDPRELEAFAEHFKQRRIKLGVTQADVGSALGKLKIPGVGSLSQSTICRFESLTLSHNNMIALKPVLQTWLENAEEAARISRAQAEAYSLSERKRKRTSIAAPEKRSLEAYFAIQPRPSGEKIAQIAEKLDLKKNVVRVWFCNQRQKQKRMKFSATVQGQGQQSPIPSH